MPPRATFWVTLALAAPMPACALAMVFGSITVKLTAYIYLVNYGAVLLAFAGAVHWGLAVARGDRDWNAYVFAAVMVLVAWLALGLVQPGPRFIVLGLGFFAVFIADRRAVTSGQAPDWHRGTRKLFTMLVLSSLALAFAAVRYGAG